MTRGGAPLRALLDPRHKSDRRRLAAAGIGLDEAQRLLHAERQRLGLPAGASIKDMRAARAMQTGPRGGQFYVSPRGMKVYTNGRNPHLDVEPTLRRTSQAPPSENVAPLDDPVDYEERFCGRMLDLERESSGGLADDPEPVVDAVPFKNLRGEGRVGIDALTEHGQVGRPSRTWRP